MAYNTDKYLWLVIMALFAGLILPFFLANIELNEHQLKIYSGIATAMTMFTYAIFKKFGHIYPDLRHWASYTLLGSIVLMFSSAFSLSALSLIFAILPFPVWLHFIIGIIISLLGLFIFLNASIKENKNESS